MAFLFSVFIILYKAYGSGNHQWTLDDKNFFLKLQFPSGKIYELDLFSKRHLLSAKIYFA